MSQPKKISILGSTGSIGISTIDIVKRHPDRFQVVGLAAGSNLKILSEQIKALKPQVVSVKSEAQAQTLKNSLDGANLDILFGTKGACQVASLQGVDLVVSAIVGAAGLLPTLSALEHGKTVGLANKESMVIAGELMYQAASKSGATILPIDSEHSALFQCLEGHRSQDIHKLILTASGGPFLHTPPGDFKKIKVSDALKHPNWNMGAKITIDSATMMNKGLEVMEARWLFNVPVQKIDVCVHPQSIIHSMVEYIDGSVIAQMGLPDMKVPIAYALSYPERIETGVDFLNLYKQKELTFFKPDFVKFPCLKYAFDVADQGQSYPAVLNAANEVAVNLFLNQKISFVMIPPIVDQVIQKHQAYPIKDLADVLRADQWAREYAQQVVGRRS